jgi:hypothetical protein
VLSSIEKLDRDSGLIGCLRSLTSSLKRIPYTRQLASLSWHKPSNDSKGLENRPCQNIGYRCPDIFRCEVRVSCQQITRACAFGEFRQDQLDGDPL